MAQATVRILLTPDQPTLVGLPLSPAQRTADALGLRLGVSGDGFVDGARLLILAPKEGERVLAAFTPFGPTPSGGRWQYDLILSGPRLSMLRADDGLRLHLLYVAGQGAGGDLSVDLTLLD